MLKGVTHRGKPINLIHGMGATFQKQNAAPSLYHGMVADEQEGRSRVAKRNHADIPNTHADDWEVKPEQECWEDMCNAVVLQAVGDYRRLMKKLKRADNKERIAELEQGKRELETFFCSDWFNMFTMLDGKMILKRLQEEVDGND